MGTSYAWVRFCSQKIKLVHLQKKSQSNLSVKIKGLAGCQCTNMPGAMVPAPPPKDLERHVDVGLSSPALQLPPTRLLSCRDILASPLTAAADGDWRFRIVSGMVTITIYLSCLYYNQTKLRVSSDKVLVFL